MPTLCGGVGCCEIFQLILKLVKILILSFHASGHVTVEVKTLFQILVWCMRIYLDLGRRREYLVMKENIWAPQ